MHGTDRPSPSFVVVLTLVAGTALLAVTFAVPRHSLAFYLFGLTTAAAWTAGAVAAGPPPTGWPPTPEGRTRRVVFAVAAAAGAFGAFVAATFVARHLPVLSTAVDRVLGTADTAPTLPVLALALVSGVAEEMFFRGALVDVLPARRRWVGSTAIYAAVTMATGNAALVVAAVAMGIVFALERRATGGVVAPAATHLTWSTLMLLALPR